MNDHENPSARPPLVPRPRSPRVAALLGTEGALAAEVVAMALHAPKVPPLQGGAGPAAVLVPMALRAPKLPPMQCGAAPAAALVAMALHAPKLPPLQGD
jgi:hypothetical protein